MNLADEIRNSFRLSEEFIMKNILPDLKGSGSVCIICDHHIDEICNYAIPFEYGNSLEEWARKNGFRVNHKFNSYGVRHIEITI